MRTPARRSVGSCTGALSIGLPNPVPFTSALLFFLAAVAFSRFNWRCPVCGAHLSDPKKCKRCEVALR